MLIFSFLGNRVKDTSGILCDFTHHNQLLWGKRLECSSVLKGVWAEHAEVAVPPGMMWQRSSNRAPHRGNQGYGLFESVHSYNTAVFKKREKELVRQGTKVTQKERNVNLYGLVCIQQTMRSLFFNNGSEKQVS